MNLVGVLDLAGDLLRLSCLGLVENSVGDTLEAERDRFNP